MLVIWSEDQKKTPEAFPNIAECASQVEFMDILLDALLDGKVVTMADAERCYQHICYSKGVKSEDMISRKSLKALIENELFTMDLVFTNPVSRNQLQRIMLKSVSDAPVLEEISKRVSNMAGVSANKEMVQKAHYESKRVLNRENNTRRKLSTELKRTGNPFSHDGPELLNIATKIVFGKDIEKDVSRV